MHVSTPLLTTFRHELKTVLFWTSFNNNYAIVVVLHSITVVCPRLLTVANSVVLFLFSFFYNFVRCPFYVFHVIVISTTKTWSPTINSCNNLVRSQTLVVIRLCGSVGDPTYASWRVQICHLRWMMMSSNRSQSCAILASLSMPSWPQSITLVVL